MIKKIIFVSIFFVSSTIFMFVKDVSSEFPLSELLLAEPPVTISLDFKDASLKDILKVLSIQSGLNFIASQAVQDRKITLYLDKVPLDLAMDKLFKANNLTYELDRFSHIFIVKDWGVPTVETITKVFTLKHATVSNSTLMADLRSHMVSTGETGTGAGTATQASTVSGITEGIKKVLSKDGNVIEEPRTNSLIITDVPSKFPVIEELISCLDVPVPQVMLEVEMLDVSKNTVDKLGLKFGQTPLTMILKGAKRFTKFPFSAWAGGDFDSARTSTTAGNIESGSVDFSTSYTVLLDFLRTQSDTKYLARPRILTLNNETAEIKIETQEMVGTVTVTTTAEGTATTTSQAERVETGVRLRVTPQVNPDTGEITMFILPVVKDTATSTLNQSYKDPEERSTKSIVKVKDGDTVIIGGLIRNDTSQTITKLPILGDIPILGVFFRHKNKDKDRERELLIFITPHIMEEGKPKLAMLKNNFSLEREQTIKSGLKRQDLINRFLNNLDKRRER